LRRARSAPGRGRRRRGPTDRLRGEARTRRTYVIELAVGPARVGLVQE
jgi:hypothetical protein